MTISNEIASITILVPYHNGKETINQIIPFKVYEDQKFYKAIPLITIEERKLTGLPAEISFRLLNYKAIPTADTKTENINVIDNIVRELQMLRLV